MLRILFDQDFDHNILRGIVQRIPGIDYLSAYEADTGEMHDTDVLLWAAQKKRILITHDLKTMPSHYASLYSKGIELQGVFVVPRSVSMARSIEELSVLIHCSENEEWVNLLTILPL